MDIGIKLKNRRKELDYTMLEVARKVGVSEATVSRWESGDIANMRRDKIALLANALKVSPSFIMGWEDTENQQTMLPQKITEDVTVYPIIGEITRFYGIIIKMFFKPKEHEPSHIHALYGEYVGIFDLNTLKMIEGDLPNKAQMLVYEWLSIYRDDLKKMWDSKSIKKLPPLN